MSAQLEELVLALGERKVLQMLRAGANGVRLTAAEKSLLGIAAVPVRKGAK